MDVDAVSTRDGHRLHLLMLTPSNGARGNEYNGTEHSVQTSMF